MLVDIHTAIANGDCGCSLAFSVLDQDERRLLRRPGLEPDKQLSSALESSRLEKAKGSRSGLLLWPSLPLLRRRFAGGGGGGSLKAKALAKALAKATALARSQPLSHRTLWQLPTWMGKYGRNEMNAF